MQTETKPISLSEVIKASEPLGSQVFVATVSPSGMPYVTPVATAWQDEKLWAAVGLYQAKIKNIKAGNNQVSCHWAAGEATNFDSLMLWGTAEIFDDVETKRRLWEGVFDYDLTAMNGGGPEDTPHSCMLAITPRRALILRHFGFEGREAWKAE